MKSERIFADTNLFLRYLTNDVPQQADAVEQLLRRAAAGELVLITNTLVIAEIVWTLETFYQLPRSDIKDKVLAILNTPGLDVADAELILEAMTWYTEKNVDFIDAYNAADAGPRAEDCLHVRPKTLLPPRRDYGNGSRSRYSLIIQPQEIRRAKQR